MPDSLVSVVMPVFNGAPFLSESVGSVLRQTHRALELIAVDDGSTDGSPALLRSFPDRRLKVLDIPHGGVDAALNAGIRAASGGYFARMDCDDIALPFRLEKQLAFLEGTGADAAGGGVEIFTDSGAVLDGMRRYGAWLNAIRSHGDVRRNLFIENPLPSPTLFMRLDALRRIGGYDPGVYPDDYNLTLKGFSRGLKLGNVPETVLRWRDHPGRLSRVAPELRNQRFFDLKSRYFKRLYGGVKRPFVIWGVGRNGKDLFRAFEKEGIPVAGFTSETRFIREKSLYGRPVRPFDQWEGAFFVLAVAAKGAREKIRHSLSSAGLGECGDFIAFC